MFFGIVGFLLFFAGLGLLIFGFVQQVMKRPLLVGRKNSIIITVVGIFLFLVGALSGGDAEAENSSETTAQAESAAAESAEKRAAAESVADAEIKAAEESMAAEKEAQAAAESQAVDEAKAAREAALAAEEAAKAAEAAALLDRSTYRWDISYDNLARTPDDFEGQKVGLYGRVVQVMEGNGTTQLRVAVNDDYDTVVLVEYDSSISSMRVLEDDFVDMYGTSYGLYTYTSTMGGEITIPALGINVIDIHQ